MAGPTAPAFPIYTDDNGEPLEGGYVYFGTANQNPQTNPASIFWDILGTIPAAQPVRTSGGYLVRNGTPATVFVTGDYSTTVRDRNGALVYSSLTSVNPLVLLGATSGADRVGFTAPGVGAVTDLTVGEVLNYDVDAAYYSTLQQALTAATGRTLRIRGEHTLNESVVVPPDTDVWLDNATIDASGATITSPALISCIGAIGSALGGGLSTNYAAGVRSIVLNSAPALAAGDLVALRSTVRWNPGNAAWTKGEFLIVKSVSGATVTFTTPTLDSYTAAAGSLIKVTPTRTRIYGTGKIIGNSADTANMPMIQIKYGMGNEVSGLQIESPTSHGIEAVSCYAPTIHNVKVGKYEADVGAIQGVGILVSGCQYAHVYDCSSHAHRHAASTGGGGLVVDRFNLFEHNSLGSAAGEAAADYHGNAEFCTYRENYIVGHINLSGSANSIIDNEVYGSVLVPTCIRLEFAVSMEFTISGNRFYLSGVGYIIDGSSANAINSDTTRDGTFKVRDNKTIDSYAGNNSYIFLRNNGSTADNRIEIVGNEFRKTNTAFYGAVCAIDQATGDDFALVRFKENSLVYCHMGSIAGDEIVVGDNNEIRFGTELEDSQLAGSASNITYENNYVKGGGRVSITVKGGGSKNLRVVCRNNRITQTTHDQPLIISTAERVICGGNVIGSESDVTQVNPIGFYSIDELYIQDDIYVGDGAPFFDTVFVAPSSFTFNKTVSVAVAATTFTIWAVPANMTFVPVMTQARSNTVVTATTGDFWAIGVAAANRRRSFGGCTAAAAGSQHAKNAKEQWASYPDWAMNLPVRGGTDTLALNSNATDADNSIAGSNMGAAAQSFLVRIQGNLIGNMVNAA